MKSIQVENGKAALEVASLVFNAPPESNLLISKEDEIEKIEIPIHPVGSAPAAFGRIQAFSNTAVEKMPPLKFKVRTESHVFLFTVDQIELSENDVGSFMKSSKTEPMPKLPKK